MVLTKLYKNALRLVAGLNEAWHYHQQLVGGYTQARACDGKI
jgi:hypothetical protein